MFAVVLYTTEDNAPGVVPVNWICTNGSTVLHPPCRATTPMVKRCEAPRLDWVKYPVRVLGKYATYDLAQKKCLQAEDTSSLDTEEETCNSLPSKRQRMEREIYSPPPPSYHSRPVSKLPPNSIASQSQYPAPIEPECSNVVVVGSLQEQFLESSDDEEPSSSSEAPEIVQGQNPAHAPNSVAVDDKADRALSILIELKEELKSMRSTMDLMNNRLQTLEERLSMQPSPSSVSSRSLPPLVLPLETLEQFDEAEKSQSKLNQLVSRLSSCGGKCVRSHVSSLMKALMTDELANNFTLTGRSGKRAFSGTQIYQRVRSVSTAQFRDQAKLVLSDCISNWFSQAKWRLKRGNSLEESNAETQTSSEETFFVMPS